MYVHAHSATKLFWRNALLLDPVSAACFSICPTEPLSLDASPTAASAYSSQDTGCGAYRFLFSAAPSHLPATRILPAATNTSCRSSKVLDPASAENLVHRPIPELIPDFSQAGNYLRRQLCHYNRGIVSKEPVCRDVGESFATHALFHISTRAFYLIDLPHH